MFLNSFNRVCICNNYQKALNQISVACRKFSSSSTCFDKGEELLVERLSGECEGITIVGLNRPQTRNAFGKKVLHLFQSMLEKLKYDQNLRVVIARSTTPGIFSAGADLKERAVMTPDEVAQFVGGLRRMMYDFTHLPVPTIAALDGVAVGGGLEFALTSDIRVAADNARVGLVETKLAIIPGAGGTQNLTRAVGPSIAKELIFTGRLVDGVQAHQIGLVNHVVTQNENGDAAYLKALELAKEIKTQGPVALRMAKQAISRGLDVDITSGLAFEEACYAQVIPTKDRLEGLKAFKEKRKPEYKGN